MSTRSTALALAAAIALTGCARPDKRPTDADVQLATTPLHCQGADQCAAYWQRSLEWIKGGHYPIVTSDDKVIETDSTYAEMWFSYKATRVSGGAGGEEIVFELWCRNRFACVSHPDTQAASFRRYVTGTGH